MNLLDNWSHRYQWNPGGRQFTKLFIVKFLSVQDGNFVVLEMLILFVELEQRLCFLLAPFMFFFTFMKRITSASM